MNTITSVLSRDYGVKSTLGCWYVFEGNKSLFNCVAIELPIFVIPMRLNSQKIDCIHGGMVYEMEKIFSTTKGECFLLKNVPGRTAVEVHIGNFATGKKVDTEGCILPGMRFKDINNDGELDVEDSTGAMKTLLALLPDKSKLYIL
jgi:hypothetical protein